MPKQGSALLGKTLAVSLAIHSRVIRSSQDLAKIHAAAENQNLVLAVELGTSLVPKQRRIRAEASPRQRRSHAGPVSR
jgi:hypothetical protein